MTSLRFDCPALGLLHLHGSITQKYTLNGMRTYLESLFFFLKKNYIRGPTLYKSDTLKTFGRKKTIWSKRNSLSINVKIRLKCEQ